MCVRKDPQTLGPWDQPLKVTQGHQKCHGSVDTLWFLLLIHVLLSRYAAIAVENRKLLDFEHFRRVRAHGASNFRSPIASRTVWLRVIKFSTVLHLGEETVFCRSNMRQLYELHGLFFFIARQHALAHRARYWHTISVCLSVSLSVCHVVVVCQNKCTGRWIFPPSTCTRRAQNVVPKYLSLITHKWFKLILWYFAGALNAYINIHLPSYICVRIKMKILLLDFLSI